MKILLAHCGIFAFMLVTLLLARVLAADADKSPVTSAPSTPPAATPSVLETSPAGWIDLLEANTLDGWTRVSIPTGPLNAKNPWSLDPANHKLICDGVGIHEMLLFNKPFADGIFHVEWRFRKIENKKGYNSGVFVRTSADGKIWHQAQVGNVHGTGYIFGDSPVDGVIKRIQYDDKVPPRAKGPGEWNTFEVTCRGKIMTLWINGGITATWNNCQVPDGLVGLEAEGWFIEFRNVKFLPSPPLK